MRNFVCHIEDIMNCIQIKGDKYAAAAVQANHPISSGLFYFEISIVDKGYVVQYMAAGAVIHNT